MIRNLSEYEARRAGELPDLRHTPTRKPQGVWSFANPAFASASDVAFEIVQEYSVAEKMGVMYMSGTPGASDLAKEPDEFKRDRRNSTGRRALGRTTGIASAAKTGGDLAHTAVKYLYEIHVDPSTGMRSVEVTHYLLGYGSDGRGVDAFLSRQEPIYKGQVRTLLGSGGHNGDWHAPE
jgi:hypothetical protein